jgi:hypothetical protein
MLGLKLEGALHWVVGGPILVLQEFMGGRKLEESFTHEHKIERSA